MRLVLAPMEGLADNVMRDALTRVPGVDWCVSEFIRVTGSLLPRRTFTRVVPELRNAARTRSGVPVRVQLLGSDPVSLADNAARAAELGAPVVDLNFGCPAKTVNRHRGGAVLLEEPELLFQIMSEVRKTVPAQVPVTAKMRLGVNDTTPAIAAAQALCSGGAAELVVHARTKQQGYRPPAHWEWIARIAEQVTVPVIANGEIWSVADYLRCRQVSGLQDVMIGRGLVARPDLALQIRSAAGEVALWHWADMLPILADFFAEVRRKVEPKHAPGRLKQWLGYLRRSYPEAESLYGELRTLLDPDAITARLLRPPAR
ncbi:tRNA dihydrouridine synthase [Leeia aquatica]|uniref:tRNA-dihydrouridine(16) synthase n=1 Tax=Leeia aquatica TaxID=2725557 RepID=A0A847S3L4_9NEIS|nr:tRNA-dihydrouridine synthase [Leeia aquatica]NLR73757.1 tRNA dihydrouridine(16) synthase DusC [Leeia aquatica]